MTSCKSCQHNCQASEKNCPFYKKGAKPINSYDLIEAIRMAKMGDYTVYGAWTGDNTYTATIKFMDITTTDTTTTNW